MPSLCIHIHSMHMHYTHDYMLGACSEMYNCPWLASYMVGESKPAYEWVNQILVTMLSMGGCKTLMIIPLEFLFCLAMWSPPLTDYWNCTHYGYGVLLMWAVIYLRCIFFLNDRSVYVVGQVEGQCLWQYMYIIINNSCGGTGWWWSVRSSLIAGMSLCML